MPTETPEGWAPPTHPPRGPGELVVLLAGLREQLGEVDRQLQAAHEVEEEAEFAWTEHLDEVVETMEEEAAEKKKALPGEALREARARRAGGAEKWSNYRRAVRAVKRLEKRATMIQHQIGSCQSEAKLLGAR